MHIKPLQRLRSLALVAGMSVTGWAQAESLQVSIEIPRLKVAEYHKPYVAVWLEDESRRATQLAVWYDVHMPNDEGKKWLKDLRQWWRRGGRSLDMPVDGITSATYGPGEHQLELALDREQLAALKPGSYRLRVEAAREVGGRELVEIPLTWPLDKSALPLTGSGNTELGAIRVALLP
ncbi:DUF2271 domain-containing protein [Microbulbifer thermotolerans]|uniref:DUF2271 domain-containing protein n=1 Tax=Microbulbifer thermotolerans TaxID=252514 RepID=A0A143HK39_MICTH|nr:DUF2271 domain-containing protein [Microbulbifer thermotolerans]AMX02104.1 hypothetical protein A3224_05475 [Microbulbifer thermotolerans]MCX2778940.1 DUF2271 domain-containing protein [Microbulbifer thermotolerans]MCX2781428.1 DUF2271 domain-containing protein [Microbulbifer thermotolerans]MCX2793825.1 DUF2271 domain-containing protein [Microbulbifer thermotolerans]MCX2802386.1 DUF2271 domain-containing protein [Microbulbifer thermotolerans]